MKIEKKMIKIIVILCNSFEDAQDAFELFMDYLETFEALSILKVYEYSYCVETDDKLRYIFIDYRFKSLALKFDDTIDYIDCDRSVCVDIINNQIYEGGIGLAVLDEMFPISFPYSPNGKIKIFTENFKVYDEDGDFDIFGVLYFRLTDGQMIEVKRLFKENHETHRLEEIGKTEHFKKIKKI